MGAIRVGEQEQVDRWNDWQIYIESAIEQMGLQVFGLTQKWKVQGKWALSTLPPSSHSPNPTVGGFGVPPGNPAHQQSLNHVHLRI
jgi:hypothetical protein